MISSGKGGGGQVAGMYYIKWPGADDASRLFSVIIAHRCETRNIIVLSIDSIQSIIIALRCEIHSIHSQIIGGMFSLRLHEILQKTNSCQPSIVFLLQHQDVS